MLDDRLSRTRWARPLGRALLTLLLFSGSPAESFADVVSDFLYYREDLAARGDRAPTGTLFLDGGVALSDQRFDFVSADTVSYAGQVGILYRLHDRLLVHGAFQGSGFNTKFEFDDSDDDIRFKGHFVEGDLGGNVIYLDSRPLKGWLTLFAGFGNSDTEDDDAFWSWRTGLSTTLSWRLDDFLLEPNVGISFSDTFDRDTKTFVQVGVGFAAKYRGERWRPQVNFSYSTVVHPDVDDDGFINVGPEVVYAVTPALLFGIGYTYSTRINGDDHFNGHAVTFSARWTF